MSLQNAFELINPAFNRLFKPGRLSLGLVIPIEQYANGPVPTMQDHLSKVMLAEQLGFKAVWVRDVPMNDPSFGDAGQTFDPFTYLGYLASQTSKIALGVSSIALPLHHPVHVAKSAATIDQLSKGRLIMGVASGDRPIEYPAMGIEFENRDELFRQSFNYIRNAASSFPQFESAYGTLNGRVDILPKPFGNKIPMLITGHSRQSVEWIAEHGDGWMYYPRNFYMQENYIRQWREAIPQNHDKPFMSPLYVILEEDDDFKPQHIQLGFRIGSKYLIEYLETCRSIGVNHVGINLRFNSRSMQETMEHLASTVLPHFHTETEKV